MQQFTTIAVFLAQRSSREHPKVETIQNSLNLQLTALGAQYPTSQLLRRVSFASTGMIQGNPILYDRGFPKELTQFKTHDLRSILLQDSM